MLRPRIDLSGRLLNERLSAYPTVSKSSLTGFNTHDAGANVDDKVLGCQKPTLNPIARQTADKAQTGTE
jgi:hypothetical protein